MEEVYRWEGARRDAVTNNLVVFANARDIPLQPEDIDFVDGEPEIDGMPAEDWLEHMTEEKPPGISPRQENH